jgi:hypothetical protein
MAVSVSGEEGIVKSFCKVEIAAAAMVIPLVLAAPSGTAAPNTPPTARDTSCTPKIGWVEAFKATATQTVEITGSCFGARKHISRADTAYFRITDLTARWNACWTRDFGGDQVTCSVSSWTDHEITFRGYSGAYGSGTWLVTRGDLIKIQVWNPQSGQGPASCEVVAGSGAPTTCSAG